MKPERVFQLMLVPVVTLIPAALGRDWVLATLRIISGWLMALPAPTDSWAALLGDWAWPATILIIVWLFRRQLRLAATHLAWRFRTARIKAGIFEIDAATSLIALNEADRDTQVKERMWEFVGASDENWNTMLTWIAQRIATGVEIEDFLSEAIFADEREIAYRELVEGR